MNMVKSLQNAVLKSCGYIAFGYSFYVSTLYRLPILHFSSVPVQDYKTLRVNESPYSEVFLKVLLRICVLSLPVTILIQPELFLKGQPLVLLFTNVIVPLLLISLYMVTMYDKIIFCI